MAGWPAVLTLTLVVLTGLAHPASAFTHHRGRWTTDIARRANQDDELDLPEESLTVRNGKGRMIPRDNRDSLPFEVSIISPPPRRQLGLFALDKLTRSGDVIEHGERSYEVRRVRCLFKWNGSGFVMTRKIAETAEVARASVEDQLSEMVNWSEMADERDAK